MFPTQATEAPNQTHRIKSFPAPIGGLNTRDDISALPLTDCPVLVNWIPGLGGLSCRKGTKEWALNFPGNKPIEAIFAYFNAADTFPGGTFLTEPAVMPGNLFAATQDGIYDITSSTDTPVLSQALTDVEFNGWFHTSMLTNAAGSYLLATNEVDGYYYFNGSAWTKPTAGAGAGQINGVNPSNLTHVNVWKRRAWFVEKATTKAWYLAADAITGTATAFDFGPIFKRGGELAFTASWTIDAGEGIDDFLAVVSSNGEVLVYKGTDPASATTFALVGSWYVGQIPVGRRGHVQLGGDLVLLSSEGIFPLSYVTRGGTDLLIAANKEYSTKIRPTIGTDLKNTFSLRGWQMINNGGDQLLVVSKADPEDAYDEQYAMSTSLLAWTTFEGIKAYSMGAVAGYLFFGTYDGKVYLYNGFQDNVPRTTEIGEVILTKLQMPFSYFDTPAQQKHFHLCRASVLTSAEPYSALNVGVDFTYRELNVPVGVIIPPAGSRWGSAIWGEAFWSNPVYSRARVFNRWRAVNGVGFSAGAIYYAAFYAPAVLASVDYVYDVGGSL